MSFATLTTTPFGRRPLTLAQVATQMTAKARPPDKVVHKWQVFRAICAARARVGVSERALAVLDALLSFHPETVLGGQGLIVFPSNNQLALRAHGMAPATLRRHLSALVEAGLIIRRDSPNGKRFARKSRAGEIETAYGFDLAPLVARAEEFEAWAEAVRAEQRGLRILREKITLLRRDIAKMLATGVAETGPNVANWRAFADLFRALLARIPRTAGREDLEPIAQDLATLADEVLTLLETQIKSLKMSANESQNERHIQNSNPENLIALEPVFQTSQGANLPPRSEPGKLPAQIYPLSMVLAACPDLQNYAKAEILNWRDFRAVASVTRATLGVSPSAWAAAEATIGEIPAAIVVAAILQKGSAITSAGGYLRELTRKAEQGEFTLGPMLMALMSARKRAQPAPEASTSVSNPLSRLRERVGVRAGSNRNPMKE